MGFKYEAEDYKELVELFQNNEIVKNWLSGNTEIKMEPAPADAPENQNDLAGDGLLREFQDLYGKIANNTFTSDDFAKMEELSAKLFKRAEIYRDEHAKDTQMDITSDKEKLYYQLSTLVESACTQLSVANILHEQTNELRIANDYEKEKANRDAELSAVANMIVNSKDADLKKEIREIGPDGRYHTLKELVNEYQGRYLQYDSQYTKGEAELAQLKSEKEQLEAEMEELQNRFAKTAESAPHYQNALKEHEEKVAAAEAQVKKMEAAWQNYEKDKVQKDSEKKRLVASIDKLEENLSNVNKEIEENEANAKIVNEFMQKKIVVKRMFRFLNPIEVSFVDIFKEESNKKLEKRQFADYYKNPDYLAMKEEWLEHGVGFNAETLSDLRDGLYKTKAGFEQMLADHKEQLNTFTEENASLAELNAARNKLKKEQEDLESVKKFNLSVETDQVEEKAEIVALHEKIEKLDKKMNYFVKNNPIVLSRKFICLDHLNKLNDVFNAITPIDEKAKETMSKVKKLNADYEKSVASIKPLKERIHNKTEAFYKQMDFLKGNHKDSAEYKALRTAIEAARNAKDSDELTKKETPDSPSLLDTLKDCAIKYKTAKNNQWRIGSKLGESRLSLADSIISYCDAAEKQLKDLDKLEAAQRSIKTYIDENLVSDADLANRTDYHYVSICNKKVTEMEKAKAKEVPEAAQKGQDVEIEAKAQNPVLP